MKHTSTSVCSTKVIKLDCLLYKLRGFNVTIVGRFAASNILLFRLFVTMILIKGVQINRKKEEANKQEDSIKLEGVGGRNGCTRFVFYST